jgi:hypothetical protein
VSGEDPGVSGAELHHKLLPVVVRDQCDIHIFPFCLFGGLTYDPSLRPAARGRRPEGNIMRVFPKSNL